MNKHLYSIAFSCFVFILFVWMAWEAASFQKLASYFPFYISLVGILVCLVDIFLQIKRYRIQRTTRTETLTKYNIDTVKYILWIASFPILILLIGFIPGTVVFLFAFFTFETKWKLLRTCISIAIVIVVLVSLGNIMNFYWPSGWLISL